MVFLSLAYICIYVYICIYAYEVYVCTYVCMHICICTYVNICEQSKLQHKQNTRQKANFIRNRCVLITSVWLLHDISIIKQTHSRQSILTTTSILTFPEEYIYFLAINLHCQHMPFWHHPHQKVHMKNYILTMCRRAQGSIAEWRGSQDLFIYYFVAGILHFRITTLHNSLFHKLRKEGSKTLNKLPKDTQLLYLHSRDPHEFYI